MPFYYHYGFHASAALFASLSRLPLGRAMLVYGQVLNAGISLSLYALGKALWQDWRPAAAGALLVGFATRMPAYYLSWGRYTLTAGLVLLPLAMGLAMHLLQSTHTRKNTLTLGLIAAGLLLSHYFAAFLLALFLVLLALVYLVPRWDRPLTALLRIAPVVLAAGLGLLLAGPWLLRVAEFSPASTRVSISLPGSMATLLEGERWNYLWSLLSPPSNHWLLLPAGAGLILGLAQKKRACFATWSLAIVVLMLPLGQGLGPFRPDHFAIVSFLPVAVWAAWLFWQVGCWLGKRLGLDWLKLALPTILVCAWIAWGLPLSANIVNPVTTFATPADLRARWIGLRRTRRKMPIFSSTLLIGSMTPTGVWMAAAGCCPTQAAGRWCRRCSIPSRRRRITGVRCEVGANALLKSAPVRMISGSWWGKPIWTMFISGKVWEDCSPNL